MAVKILIDAISMSHPQPGGYRTYVTNLVHHLEVIDEHNEYLIAVDRPVSWRPQRPRWQLLVAERRGSVGAVLREQITIPRISRTNDVDLIHSPSATAPLHRVKPLLITLYDTIEFSEPLPSPKQLKRWGMRIYSRFVQKRIAHRASHIITISHYSKNKIADFFSVPANRITVVHLAPSPIFSFAQNTGQEDREVKNLPSIASSVLGIASAAKRKNTSSLVKAYSLLSEDLRRQHPLVLVCTHAGVRNQMAMLVEKSGLTSHTHLLENVSDPVLASLYKSASVFVFPSLEEGFGLPPLEAMACGAPVVASNTSSLPEVLGEAALLVSPTDIVGLADAIASVLTNSVLAAELRAKGLVRSTSFSWHAVAQQTMAIYEQILRT